MCQPSQYGHRYTDSVAAGREPGLRLAVSSPVRRVQGELAMGWTLARHASSLACGWDPPDDPCEEAPESSVPGCSARAQPPLHRLQRPGGEECREVRDGYIAVLMEVLIEPDDDESRIQLAPDLIGQ